MTTVNSIRIEDSVCVFSTQLLGKHGTGKQQQLVGTHTYTDNIGLEGEREREPGDEITIPTEKKGR